MNYLAPTPTVNAIDSIDMSAIDFEVIRSPVFGERLNHKDTVSGLYFGESAIQGVAVIPNLYEFRRADNDHTLGVHTGSYAHNGYQKHMNGVVEALKEMSRQDKLDMSDVSADFNVYEGGRKVKLNVTFPNHIIEPAVGDITKMRLRDWDSYDGTRGRRLSIDGMRLVCLNGMTVPDFKLSFYAKHTKAISSDESVQRMIDSMTDMIVSFNEDEDKFKRWINTPMEIQDAMGLFSTTIGWQKKAVKIKDEYKYHSVSIMEELEGLLEHNFKQAGSNLYATYNAATQWATHVNKTKGKVHNVERTRESKVASMLNTNKWKTLERPLA